MVQKIIEGQHLACRLLAQSLLVRRQRRTVEVTSSQHEFHTLGWLS
jgi:hypothetical protein